MTDERRYQEEEVREILELAATQEETGLPKSSPRDGLTLTDLQDIGREVGLEPKRIAEAAKALDVRRATLPRGTYLGMPISVGRIVDLARAPTDGEWEVLVSECRQTFRARGRVTSHGSLREWANGNLHVCVEPIEGAYRLRMGTRNGNAMATNTMGIAGLAIAAVSLGAFFVAGTLAEDLFVPTMFGVMGGVALVSNVLRMPRWAGERERQMEYIAQRATRLIEGESTDHGT